MTSPLDPIYDAMVALENDPATGLKAVDPTFVAFTRWPQDNGQDIPTESLPPVFSFRVGLTYGTDRAAGGRLKLELYHVALVLALAPAGQNSVTLEQMVEEWLRPIWYLYDLNTTISGTISRIEWPEDARQVTWGPEQGAFDCLYVPMTFVKQTTRPVRQ